MTTAIAWAARLLSVTLVHASGGNTSAWVPARDRLATSLIEAFDHAGEAESARRSHVRRVIEELWALNTSLFDLSETNRSQVASFVVGSAVRRALDREARADGPRARAVAELFLTIADEASLDDGRLMGEVAAPHLAAASARRRHRALMILPLLSVLEGGMLWGQMVIEMIVSFPILSAISIGVALDSPGATELRVNHVRPALTECESLIFRSVLRAGGVSGEVIDQAEEP